MKYIECPYCHKEKRECRCRTDGSLVLGAARPKLDFVACSEWMDEGGTALRNNLDEMTRRMARTVAALREWRTLEYIGMFIDLPDEQKAVVAEVAARTETVLREWGYEMEPRPSSIEPSSATESA